MKLGKLAKTLLILTLSMAYKQRSYVEKIVAKTLILLAIFIVE